jgi:hypothetical protein
MMDRASDNHIWFIAPFGSKAEEARAKYNVHKRPLDPRWQQVKRHSENQIHDQEEHPEEPC